MKNKVLRIGYLFCLCSVIALTGCSKEQVSEKNPPTQENIAQDDEEHDADQQEESLDDAQETISFEENVPEKEPEEKPQEKAELQEMLELPAAAEKADIQEGLRQAMEGMHEGILVDVSQIVFEQDAAMEVKNLYFQIMSEFPRLQYVYDVISEITDGQLVCSLAYMPYKTGMYPEGFEGEEVDSLEKLLQIAEENIEKDSVKVRITNPDLEVLDMQQILRQAGEGFFVCDLSQDATEITIHTGMEYSKEEGLAYMSEINQMADAVIEQCITEGMTEEEKALALYSHITDTVVYDFRYYNDRENMPYLSRSAYGALHDNLAICGGYSLAIQKLFRKVGIPCYMVSGISYGEDHLWNAARINGDWLYFDATADRGGSSGFRCFAVTAEELTGHVWDREEMEMLFRAAE